MNLLVPRLRVWMLMVLIALVGVTIGIAQWSIHMYKKSEWYRLMADLAEDNVWEIQGAEWMPTYSEILVREKMYQARARMFRRASVFPWLDGEIDPAEREDPRDQPASVPAGLPSRVGLRQ